MTMINPLGTSDNDLMCAAGLLREQYHLRAGWRAVTQSDIGPHGLLWAYHRGK